MKFLMAAGGTGGHVIPALVIAEELKARNPQSEILFVGTAKGVENRLVPNAGFKLELVKVRAWQGQSLVAKVKNLMGAPRALWQAFGILGRFQPDVVLGVGGYASGPIMVAAALRRIPLCVLEPNAFPGMANRWLGPLVKKAFLGFPEAASFFRSGGSVITGIPVRKEFFRSESKKHGTPFEVLIFGGSQGARSINRAAVEALPALERFADELRIVHQTGQGEYNSVKEGYDQRAVNATVFPYIENMPEVVANADLVICRAGANTVAELAAAGKASVLVPFPAAANQHQLRNAESLVRVGAAQLILDKDLNGETFAAVVDNLRKDSAKLEQMETNIRPLARPDATKMIADELERLAEAG